MADLRLALAVLLPLEQGLSLKQTADNIGRSVSVTCSMRTGLGASLKTCRLCHSTNSNFAIARMLT